MKELNVTRERFEKSRYFRLKYGKLKYVSESGNVFRTDKGHVLRFVKEAREYVNDDSIEPDTAEEFIIFEDPEIFKRIAEIQTDKCQEIQDEVKTGEVTPEQVGSAASGAIAGAAISAAGSVASSAITGAANLATSKAALGIAAAAGYKQVLNKAAEMGDEAGGKVGDWYADLMGYNDNIDAPKQAIDLYNKTKQAMNDNLVAYSKISNLGSSGSAAAIQMDKRAMYIANQLKSGGKIIGSKSNAEISPEMALAELKKKGYEINDQGIVNRASNWVDPKAATSAAAGAGAAGAASGTGWTMFGMSAATVGWIVAGVAAAAIITPYIYDKVRACTKTWLADIIAEVKFKADGKNYRCFYDLDENKWILTYADIKWTSYLDNKLDKETIEEFFASQFFKKFLDKCRRTFAILFSTGRNEVVFKTLPEIKDAPEELKDILEKIYDNKGAITKNLFTGQHES